MERISDYDAIGILDGFVEFTPSTFLAACKAVSERQHLRGIAHGNSTQQAIEVAQYAAKHGDDAAIDMLEGNA